MISTRGGVGDKLGIYTPRIDTTLQCVSGLHTLPTSMLLCIRPRLPDIHCLIVEMNVVGTPGNDMGIRLCEWMVLGPWLLRCKHYGHMLGH